MWPRQLAMRGHRQGAGRVETPDTKPARCGRSKRPMSAVSEGRSLDRHRRKSQGVRELEPVVGQRRQWQMQTFGLAPKDCPPHELIRSKRSRNEQASGVQPRATGYADPSPE
jgi:hypothetical protein